VPAAGLLHYGFAASGASGLVPVVLAAGLFLGGALLVLLQGDYLDDFERQVLAGLFSRRREIN